MNNATQLTPALEVKNITKTFTLHQQQGVAYTVLDDFSFSLNRGECLVLNGPSGQGKSTALKILYANYLPDSGEVWFHFNNHSVELYSSNTHQVVYLRENHIGYVSQFLRVIPRVSALDIVAEPLISQGFDESASRDNAAELLTRLNIPEKLWSLSPYTFSGGEQQRINIARGFIKPVPFLFLDEPTASLDEKNKQVVLELINEFKQNGTAVVGIFHDADIRQDLADKIIDL